MKRIVTIWIVGVVLNVFLISLESYVFNFFQAEKHIPINWVMVNFIPISLMISYYTYRSVSIESKRIFYLLLLFLGLCLTSLFSRSLTPSYEKFLAVVQYTPFLLIPLQVIILTLLLKIGKLKNQLNTFFKSKNRDQVIQLIQDGKTSKAIDLLLAESKATNNNVFKYLSLQKNTLVTVKRQHLSNTIDDEKYRRTVAKVSQSLLDLMIRD